MTIQPIGAPAAVVPAPVFGGVDHDGLDNLRRWVAAASDAAQLVTPLVQSAFVPEAYKPRVDPRATPEEKAAALEVAVANATAAVLQGISLGVDPLVALQQIYIVHGRPGMYAKFAVALVQQAGHEVWTEESTDSRAVVCGRRRGTTEAERVTVTIDQAKRAGWTSNQAYTKTPADMLWARAAARVCDRIASDVLKGIAAVEVIDDPDQPAAPATRAVQRASRTTTPAIPLPAAQAAITRAETAPVTAAPPGLPPLPGEIGAAHEDAPTVDSVTDAQLRKLGAVLTELGVRGQGERALRLAVASDVVGRDLGSAKELTKDEATVLIDTLEADGAVIVAKHLDAIAAQDAEAAASEAAQHEEAAEVAAHEVQQ